MHRRDADLYMWLSKSPNGPAFKFLVEKITPLRELKLSGNNLKHSRALVSFDKHFDELPQLQLAKEMLSHCFNTPKNHPKSKPFVDHVIAFHWYEGAIFFRHYQVLNQNEEQFTRDDDIDKLILIEIGPRFSLVPIKAFEGSMGGETLWQNEAYIAPQKRRGKKFVDFSKKRADKAKRKERHETILREGRDPDSYLKEAFKP